MVLPLIQSLPASCSHFIETDNVLLDRDLFISYKKRLLHIAWFNEINSRILLLAKTREHTAYDFDFQEIIMTFRKFL